MRYLSLLRNAALGTLFTLAACTGSQKTSQKENAKLLIQEMSTPCFLLTDSMLPQSVDLKQDISQLSYQELRLLRNYPYALNGYWFREGDLNAFFYHNAPWYYPLCDSIYWTLEEAGQPLPDSYDDVKLSPEETDFVMRIDRRMKALEAECGTGALNNPRLCVNWFQMETPDEEFAEKLGLRNFAIAESDYEQLFQVYEANDYRMSPNFITTDVYLQATHMYFSYVLKYLEQKKFIPALLHTAEAFHKACMSVAQTATADSLLRDHAEWNATFFAIATRLLGGEECTVPGKYRKDYTAELQRIENLQDDCSPYLDYMDAYFPYSLFKPRGHYTRNETAQRYFRAMMWLQTAPFCRENRTQLGRAAFMAQTFNALPEETRRECRGVFDALTFLMGEPDNLSVMEIADWMRENGLTKPQDTTDNAVLEALNTMLAEAFKTRNRIKPKVEVSCADKINFLPQRYVADNEVLNAMADPAPNCDRAFPRGLDVMAAFGNRTAEQILDTCYHDAERWSDYEKTAREMKERFADGIDGNASMYNKWFETLLLLQNTDKNYPGFMQTPEWQCKALNTALASWAELKHDAILYAEQPMLAECGGGGLPDPVVVGYVEPNVSFWRGLKDLLSTNRLLLERSGLLDETLTEKSEELEEKVDFCLTVSEKELRGETLSSEEYQTIQKMGSSLEWFTLGILDPDEQVACWSDIKSADRSVAVVADVFTRNIDSCKKNGILHEATGNTNVIYVLVNIGGKVYLTSGGVFSYYEFVRPLGERLTDEEWQKLLQTDRAPQVPEWMRPLKLKQRPVHNETHTYSSGC